MPLDQSEMRDLISDSWSESSLENKDFECSWVCDQPLPPPRVSFKSTFIYLICLFEVSSFQLLRTMFLACQNLGGCKSLYKAYIYICCLKISKHYHCISSYILHDRAIEAQLTG